MHLFVVVIVVNGQGRCVESRDRVADGVIIRRILRFIFDDSPNGEEHDVQSRMFRSTTTDMQDKYSGNCYNIYLIQSQYKGGGAAVGRATH